AGRPPARRPRLLRAARERPRPRRHVRRRRRLRPGSAHRRRGPDLEPARGRLRAHLRGRGPAVLSSLILVHGSGSGPWVFDRWDDAFPDTILVAPDLHEGFDVAGASMEDFARATVRA